MTLTVDIADADLQKLAQRAVDNQFSDYSGASGYKLVVSAVSAAIERPEFRKEIDAIVARVATEMREAVVRDVVSKKLKTLIAKTATEMRDAGTLFTEER